MSDTGRASLAQENEALRRAITLLHRCANLLRETMEVDAACYAILTAVTAGVGLGYNRAMLFLTQESDRQHLRCTMAVGPANGDEANHIWGSIVDASHDLETLYRTGLSARGGSPLNRRVRGTLVPTDGESIIARALRTGALVTEGGSDDLGGLLHLSTAVAAPLRGAHGIGGVLYADNAFTTRRQDAVLEEIFALVADHAGRAVENAQRYERVAELARTDALTGLGHHGSLMQAAQKAVERARRGGEPVSLAMVDLDDFKRVNDTYGHLAGDALLVALSDRIRKVLRRRQEVYRFGGEEFAVIIPQANLDDAVAVGDRICRTVAEQPFAVTPQQSVFVTTSVGVATLAATHQTATDLVGAADGALLEAKARGKNQVAKA